MTALPDVKLRVVTNLPASITNGIGVTVEKLNGRYNFRLDYTDIQQAPSIPPDEYTSNWQLFWNAQTDSYTLVPYALPAAKVTGSSVTSADIGTGEISFAVEPGIGWVAGTRLRGSDSTDPTNFIEGAVTAYDPATGVLSLDVDLTGGSGTIASWVFAVAGQPGEAGAPGAGDMEKADNLAGLADLAESRENIGLGVSAGLMQLDDAANSAVIANAIAALSTAGGGTLRLLKGNYSLTDVALQSNVTVHLERDAVVTQSGGTSTSWLFSGSGAVTGSAVALTANAVEGGSTASMADTSSFAAGDHCLINDSQLIGMDGLNQEVVQILSLSSTVLTFDRPLTSEYLTASSAQIQKLEPLINAHIEGDGVINIGTGKGGGINFKYAVGCSMREGLKVNGPNVYPGVNLETSRDCQIYNIEISKAQSTSPGYGYGFQLNNSCTFCEVYSVKSVGVRENTITNRSRYNKVHDCTLIDSYDTGLNTHGAACHHNEFYDNTIIDGGGGIAIGWSSNLAADNYNTVRNNNLWNAGGIGVASASGKAAIGNMVQGNRIHNPSGSGITVSYSDRSPVLGNYIELGSGSDTGIEDYNCVGAKTCGNVVVGDGTTTGVTGIRSNDASGGTISHNSVSGINSDGGSVNYYVPTGTSVKVVLNDDDNGTVSLAGASANKLNSWN